MVASPETLAFTPTTLPVKQDINKRLRPIPALTGLRAVACLMVVLSHLPIPGLRGSFYIFERSGYCGVSFFFVLSGFVIAYNYFDKFETFNATALWNFWISRFARIYPIYIFVILGAGWFLKFDSMTPIYIFAVQAWYSSLGIAFGVVGPSWSISVEIFLYACFPFLALGFHKAGVPATLRRIALWIASICALMICLALIYTILPGIPNEAPTSAHRWLYRSPINRIGDFALGMLGAIALLRHTVVVVLYKRAWRVARYAACAVIVFLMTHLATTTAAFRWDVAYAIPFFVVIMSLSVTDASRMVRFLGSKFMVKAGEVSFSFYLVHTTVSTMWDLLDPTTGIAHYVSKLIFIALIASGLHFMVELPAQALIKKLFLARRAPSSVPA